MAVRRLWSSRRARRALELAVVTSAQRPIGQDGAGCAIVPSAEEALSFMFLQVSTRGLPRGGRKPIRTSL